MLLTKCAVVIEPVSDRLSYSKGLLPLDRVVARKQFNISLKCEDRGVHVGMKVNKEMDFLQ